MEWQWLPGHLDDLAAATVQHLQLSLLPVLLGLVISLPLGIISVRWRWTYPPIFGVANLLYALPSIALFVFMSQYVTGLSVVSAIIPLALFTLSVLVPNVVDGLKQVPDPVRQAATAVGFGTLRRLLQVELPIAIPVIVAGVRVATVASISLGSVAGIMGLGGLGQLFQDGQQRDIPSEVFAGIVLTIVLAFVCDLILVAVQRTLTPWNRARKGAAA